MIIASYILKYGGLLGGIVFAILTFMQTHWAFQALCGLHAVAFFAAAWVGSGEARLRRFVRRFKCLHPAND